MLHKDVLGNKEKKKRMAVTSANAMYSSMLL